MNKNIYLTNNLQEARKEVSNRISKLSQIDDKVKISFVNHGEMIEENKQDKIFESGFTTKKDGWGVGLAVCKKYVGSQFGTFELTKSDKDETEFSIVLPLSQIK